MGTLAKPYKRVNSMRLLYPLIHKSGLHEKWWAVGLINTPCAIATTTLFHTIPYVNHGCPKQWSYNLDFDG